MGAWDYGVFDDDTAYDALDDLKESANIVIDMEKYFNEVIKTDSVINGTSYRCDDSYSEWIETLNEFDLTPLKQKAIQAIDSVLSHHSELNELWAENEELYTSWRNDKLGIQKRLIK